MYKEIQQFMQQFNTGQIDIEKRCSSSGIGQFGNFISTRDYVTKMKIVLIEVDSYLQLSINEREISKIMLEKKSIEGKFAIAIRKSALQKINDLNCEQQEVDKIL